VVKTTDNVFRLVGRWRKSIIAAGSLLAANSRGVASLCAANVTANVANWRSW